MWLPRPETDEMTFVWGAIGSERQRSTTASDASLEAAENSSRNASPWEFVKWPNFWPPMMQPPSPSEAEAASEGEGAEEVEVPGEEDFPELKPSEKGVDIARTLTPSTGPLIRPKSAKASESKESVGARTSEAEVVVLATKEVAPEEVVNAPPPEEAPQLSSATPAATPAVTPAATPATTPTHRVLRIPLRSQASAGISRTTSSSSSTVPTPAPGTPAMSPVSIMGEVETSRRSSVASIGREEQVEVEPVMARKPRKPKLKGPVTKKPKHRPAPKVNQDKSEPVADAAPQADEGKRLAEILQELGVGADHPFFDPTESASTSGASHTGQRPHTGPPSATRPPPRLPGLMDVRDLASLDGLEAFSDGLDELADCIARSLKAKGEWSWDRPGGEGRVKISKLEWIEAATSKMQSYVKSMVRLEARAKPWARVEDRPTEPETKHGRQMWHLSREADDAEREARMVARRLADVQARNKSAFGIE